jgi:PAS domain S-box-containing protein
MLVDITDRKMAEEALRRREEFFRSVFESSAVGVAILTPDTRFVQANNAFCSTVGYSEDELRGLDCRCLTHQDDLAAMEKLLPQLIAGEIPTFVLEKRYFKKNGELIWVRNSVSVMRDAAGRPEHLIVLCEDITGRKRAERAMRETEERFRAIFETTPECVKVVGADGTLLQMNSAGLAMVGADRAEDVIGKSVYQLIAPEFRETFREFNERVCGGEKGRLEFDIQGLKGRRRHMESHAAPLRTPDGSVVQLAITHDVTERRRADHATRLLGAIVESSDDAIVSKDLNGIVTSWNKGAERLFGYTAEEAVGKSITLIIPPDRLDEEPMILGKLRRGERVDHFETIRRRKDGTLLNISLTISPVKNAQGKVVGASKIARDITERKRAEEAIQDLNAQLTADLAAMARMQDLSTRLVQAEDFTVLLGEIVDAGMHIAGADMGHIQLCDADVLRIVAQRGFDQAWLRWYDAVPSGEAACGMALQQRMRVIVEDLENSPIFAGTPVLSALREAGVRAVQSTPLVSRSGQVLGVFSTYFRSRRRPDDRELGLLDILARQAADLIERVRAEKALRESEARFRELAEVGPQFIWVTQGDGGIEYVNSRWTGYSGLDLAGTADTEKLAAAIHVDDRDELFRRWRRSMENGEPLEAEARLRRRDGVFRWFMIRSVPLRGASGEIVRWFGASTDIDEQKRVEDELRRANKDLEQFAYSASHDLQEPLRGIKIFSELLSNRYSSRLDGQGLDFLQYLRSSATRMEMLVRDLLAYTQVGRLDTVDQTADANQALSEALSNLDRAIADSGAEITFGPLPAVRAHNTHLKQLFQNLVGNAIKYRSPERTPVVRVDAEKANDHWIFSVKDNGMGIPAEYKERIFGLFKRLHSGDQYSGTGIGLAICQRIVERYGGRIWVESELGKGSTFFFTLPA